MDDNLEYGEVADDEPIADEEAFGEELDDSEEDFGDADAYYDAFSTLLREGVHENHLALLRAHYAAPDQTTTWEELARAVGYARGAAVNVQYGTLAKRVANALGIYEAPNGFWIWVLVGWGLGRDPDTGHTTYYLRWPVIEALRRLGVFPTEPGGLSVDPEADLRRLIPHENLSDVLDAVAASVELAHWANPEGWVLGLEAGELVLGVGGYEILRIGPDVAPFKIVVDSGSVPAKAYARASENATFDTHRGRVLERAPFYPSAPGSELWEVPLQQVSRTHALLLAAHSAFVVEAGRGPLDPSLRELHDPRLVDFVARQLGRSLPQPSYVLR